MIQRFAFVGLVWLSIVPIASAQTADACAPNAEGVIDCAAEACRAHPECASPDPAPSSDPPAGSGSSGGTELTPRLCQNGTDDDGDGAVDCADDDCRLLIFCVNAPRAEDTAELCGNGVDEDADGDVDCADEDCVAHCPDAQVGQPGTQGIYQPRVVEVRPEMGYLEHDDPRRYPARYTERPMTFLDGMLVPRVGFSLRDVSGADPLAQLGLGLSYGILDVWQITILPVPLRLSPSFDYENPAISTTFRFFGNEIVELGLYGSVAIPVGTAENLGPAEPLPTHHLYARSRYSDVAQVDIALLVRLHLTEWLRVDLDLPVISIVASDDTRVDMTFDARLAFSPIDYLTVGVYSGAIIPGPSYEDPKIPFGFFVGGTIPAFRRGPVMDLHARFGWPLFWDDNPGPGFDPISADFWQLTFDVTIYSYLLP